MSVISSQSIFAVTGNPQNKSAQTSSTDGALFQLISQVQETSSNKESGTTSGALGVSSSAFGALFGMGGGSDPLDALFGESDSTGGAGDILSALGLSDSSGLGGDDYEFLYGGGPLPAFLAEVKAQYGLSAEQSAALDSIALKYRNAEDTPATVNQIADELAKAGIG